MTFALLGLGTAVPATQLRQHETQQIALALGCPSEEQASWLPNLYAHTGIHTRHAFFSAEEVRDVLDGTRHSDSIFLPRGTPDDRGPTTGQRMAHYAVHAPARGAAAASAALEQSGLRAADLTHLVTVSCTGFYAPGVDVALIRQLGLPAMIARTHVGYMGCHGALNGLRVARAFTDADPAARVLLCAVELCSLHYHYGWDPQKVIANALFADGAAALVGMRTPEADENCWKLAASGSRVFPDSVDAMTWTVGDHGFEMTLSRQVPELIRAELRPWLGQWLACERLTVADVGSWAVHPGGPKILDAVEAALGLGGQALACSREVLAEYGNMSSPTVLFIQQRLQEQHAPRPCVALGFGPGLTVEAALFR
jgi:predicted naringenin-chalcone synthase